MKKFAAMVIACAAVAACSSKDTVNVLGQNCQKVATGERGDMLVKCPVSQELAAVQAVAADSMYLSTNADAGVKFDEIASDAEHVYVNVIPAGTMEGQNTNCYRVTVKEPVFDGAAMYTVEICEEPVAEQPAAPAADAEQPAAPADAK